MDTIDAWYFLPYDRRLRKPLPDGTRPVITPGWTYRTERTIEMFWRRLDAHRRGIDALRLGAGPIACRVRLGGTIYETPYLRRLVATEFTVLWMADAADRLERFGLSVAERTLLRERLIEREPPLGFWDWLDIRRRLLAGEDVPWHTPAHPPTPSRFLLEMRQTIAPEYNAWPRSQWREMWQKEAVEWRKLSMTLPAVVATTAGFAGGWGGRGASTASYRRSRQRTASNLRRVLRYGAIAARLSGASWSEADEAAAGAAGLDMEPDGLNAEFERMLMASKPEDTGPT